MILTKLKLWAAWVAGVLLAIGSAWLWGRRGGKQAERQADAAREAQANVQAAQQQVQAQETRNAVEAEVQKLPDAPAQKVADADPATAAGHLHDDGWTRD